VALRKLERPIANLSRFIDAEVALLRQPDGVGLPASGGPLVVARERITRCRQGGSRRPRARLMPAAFAPLLRPVLEITGIATARKNG
jgi:hypothetical protein